MIIPLATESPLQSRGNKETSGSESAMTNAADYLETIRLQRGSVEITLNGKAYPNTYAVYGE